jgi:hypothetical protein
MSRLHVGDVPLCPSVDPSGKYAAARKNQSVRPIAIDDGQFKIAVERSARYRLPLHAEIVRPANSGALI